MYCFLKKPITHIPHSRQSWPCMQADKERVCQISHLTFRLTDPKASLMSKNMAAADLPVKFAFFNSSTKRVRACVALQPVKYANWFSSKLSLSIATSNRTRSSTSGHFLNSRKMAKSVFLHSCCNFDCMVWKFSGPL